MRALAEFIMRGRMQATLVVVGSAILPLLFWLTASASALVLLPAAAATAPSQPVGLPAVLALLVLGAVTSGFTYWISMRLMRDIPASATTSSAFLIPLFGMTWGALFLGEPLTVGLLPGVLLIFFASALLTGFNPFRAFLRGGR